MCLVFNNVIQRSVSQRTTMPCCSGIFMTEQHLGSGNYSSETWAPASTTSTWKHGSPRWEQGGTAGAGWRQQSSCPAALPCSPSREQHEASWTYTERSSKPSEHKAERQPGSCGTEQGTLWKPTVARGAGRGYQLLQGQELGEYSPCGAATRQEPQLRSTPGARRALTPQNALFSLQNILFSPQNAFFSTQNVFFFTPKCLVFT